MPCTAGELVTTTRNYYVPGAGSGSVSNASPPDRAGRPPGPDEIIVTAADGRYLCFSREHRDLGRLADVIVTFGRLGSRITGGLWHEAWGRAVPMCTACWDDTRRTVLASRPGLTVRDLRDRASGG
jgi:hypothetical protein